MQGVDTSLRRDHPYRTRTATSSLPNHRAVDDDGCDGDDDDESERLMSDISRVSNEPDDGNDPAGNEKGFAMKEKKPPSTRAGRRRAKEKKKKKRKKKRRNSKGSSRAFVEPQTDEQREEVVAGADGDNFSVTWMGAPYEDASSQRYLYQACQVRGSVIRNGDSVVLSMQGGGIAIAQIIEMWMPMEHSPGDDCATALMRWFYTPSDLDSPTRSKIIPVHGEIFISGEEEENNLSCVLQKCDVKHISEIEGDIDAHISMGDHHYFYKRWYTAQSFGNIDTPVHYMDDLNTCDMSTNPYFLRHYLNYKIILPDGRIVQATYRTLSDTTNPAHVDSDDVHHETMEHVQEDEQHTSDGAGARCKDGCAPLRETDHISSHVDPKACAGGGDDAALAMDAPPRPVAPDEVMEVAKMKELSAIAVEGQTSSQDVLESPERTSTSRTAVRAHDAWGDEVSDAPPPPRAPPPSPQDAAVLPTHSMDGVVGGDSHSPCTKLSDDDPSESNDAKLPGVHTSVGRREGNSLPPQGVVLMGESNLMGKGDAVIVDDDVDDDKGNTAVDGETSSPVPSSSVDAHQSSIKVEDAPPRPSRYRRKRRRSFSSQESISPSVWSGADNATESSAPPAVSFASGTLWYERNVADEPLPTGKQTKRKRKKNSREHTEYGDADAEFTLTRNQRRANAKRKKQRKKEERWDDHQEDQVEMSHMRTHDAHDGRDPLTLIPCQRFSNDPYAETSEKYDAYAEPQAFCMEVSNSVLLTVDVHSHLLTTEVIGFLAGTWDADTKKLQVLEAFPCRSKSEESDEMNVEVDPISELETFESVVAKGLQIVGWYHSHPLFHPDPSIKDIATQFQYQNLFADSHAPFVAAICGSLDPQLPTERSVFNWFVVREERKLRGRKSARLASIHIERIPMYLHFHVNVEKEFPRDLLTSKVRQISEITNDSPCRIDLKDQWRMQRFGQSVLNVKGHHATLPSRALTPDYAVRSSVTKEEKLRRALWINMEHYLLCKNCIREKLEEFLDETLATFTACDK